MSQFDDDKENYQAEILANALLAEARHRAAQEKIKKYRKFKHEVRPSMLERIWQYVTAPWRKRK